MFHNPYLVVPFTAWIVAQLVKFCLAAARGQTDFKYLYASGGMPSGHSAVVCALATTALLLDGPASHLFGLTVVVAAIVMYDSFGVRRSAGEQATALNMLIGSLDRDRIKLTEPSLKLREMLGHSPLEVTVGAILGTGLALAFNASVLSVQTTWLSATPGKTEILVYGVMFGLLVIKGLVAPWWLRRRYGKSVAIKALSKQFFWASELIGWPGLLLVLAQHEGLPSFSWRVWTILLLISWLVWVAYIAPKFWTRLPAALAEERDGERRFKWLNGKKKRVKKGRR